MGRQYQRENMDWVQYVHELWEEFAYLFLISPGTWRFGQELANALSISSARPGLDGREFYFHPMPEGIAI